MIYLLGVDHQVQHQKNAQVSKKFMTYLGKSIRDLKIGFVGEEWFDDLLKENNITTTTTQDIASNHRIEHRFCDPNRRERNKIGWRSKNDDHLREIYWMKKMSDKLNSNVIFICGSKHLIAFAKLLTISGHTCKILSEKFDEIMY